MTPERTVDPAHRRAGLARVKSLTPEQRSESARIAVTAAHRARTPEERSERSRKAAMARWAQVKERQAGEET